MLCTIFKSVNIWDVPCVCCAAKLFDSTLLKDDYFLDLFSYIQCSLSFDGKVVM